MKRNIGLVFLALGIFLFPMPRDRSTEQLIVTLSNPGKPGTLIIDHFKGSVSVSGYNGEVLIVKARLRFPDAKNGDSMASRVPGRTRLPSIRLSARERGNVVTVDTNCGQLGRTMDLEIEVPYNFSVKLKIQHNGVIKVTRLDGEFEATNFNGDIRLDNISGSAVVNTIDGNIVVSFSRPSFNVPMAFTSVHGKIDVTFPAEARITAKMRSDGGGVYNDFDLKMEAGNPSAGKWIYSKINGGGAQVILRSFEGNVYLRKR